MILAYCDSISVTGDLMVLGFFALVFGFLAFLVWISGK